MAYDVWRSMDASGFGALIGLDRPDLSGLRVSRAEPGAEAGIAAFGYSAHTLDCCPCGQDHSGELLAHKISLAADRSTESFSAPQDGLLFAPPGTPEAQIFNIAGEVAGGTDTTITLSVGDIANSQIDVSLDQDWYRITLQAGVTYEFRLTGTGGNALDDPYLEIMNSSGTQLKFNDDGGEGLNSLLRFTPSATGTYYLNAHGWTNPNDTPDNPADDTSTTGSYSLTAVQAPPLPTYTTAQIAAYLVNGTNSGLGPRWQQTNITYNVEDLSVTERALAQRALDMWAAVTSLTFSQTTGNANLTFVNAVVDDPNHDPDDAGNQSAYARTSTSGNAITASTVVITSGWALSSGGQSFDSYQQQTYIHEVGHALGLGHAGPYDSTADYGTDNLYTNDNWAQTVMSYFDQLEAGHGNFRYVLGLQPADISAIQMLYGSNPAGTYSGNTVFGFNSTAPGTNIDWSQFVLVEGVTYRRPPAMTIYDTGGIDTINLSGFAQPQILDLNPGAFSTLGDRPQQNPVHYVNVVSIAANTVIENAIGGSGNDTITGNSADNDIAGGSGNDILHGGTGRDVLDGESGVDTAVFSFASTAAAVIRLADGTLRVGSASVGGADTLISIETLSFSDRQLTGANVDLFQPLSYIAGYGDLVSAFGINADAALSHFLDNGFYEGRSDNNFDALTYIAGYTDLVLAFGTNTEAATLHYLNNGYSEGRNDNNFDPFSYLAGYGDLLAAFGADISAATLHYLNQGFSEGRNDASFDALAYIATYDDLIRAFGPDTDEAARHFVNNGFYEGRSSSFDAEQYLANYADLRSAFGTDYSAAAFHFITFGFYEGRTYLAASVEETDAGKSQPIHFDAGDEADNFDFSHIEPASSPAVSQTGFDYELQSDSAARVAEVAGWTDDQFEFGDYPDSDALTGNPGFWDIG